MRNVRRSAFDVTYKGSLSIPSLMTTIWAPSLEPSAEPSSLPTSTMYPTMTSEVPSGQPSSRPSSPPQQTVPTSEPSSSPPDVMTLTSSCGQPVILQFDAYLRGAQSACLNFNANSSLHSLNMTMDYGGNDDEIAGDMAFIVYHSTSLIGVQVGGHDYYIPTVVYAGPWPSSWQSGSPGLYTAAVDVSAGNLEGGEGYYYACILNGWFYGELEHYNGTVQLDSLITQCGSQSEFPTSAPSEQSERYSSDDGGDDEQTAIILASVLVPGLLIITAVIAFVMWRRRINEKAERQSMVATELGDITKDVAHSALAMSPSIANPLLGSSEEEGADTGKQRPREEQGGEDSPLW